MADRFPLIVDADNTNIKELPSGDNLDLTGSDIVNVVDVTTSGNMVVGGNLTVNGTTTTINSATLTIDDKNIVLASGAADAAAANGAGITIDGASANLTYSSSADGFSFNKSVTVPSLTTTGNISFGDNDKAIFGAGNDLQIYSDGGTGIIQQVANGVLLLKGQDFYVQNDAGSNYIRAEGSAQVDLYYGGVKKFETTSTGIQVTGDISNASGDLTLDVAGFINLDADGGDVALKDGGTEFGRIKKGGNNLEIQSRIYDGDIVLKGFDNTSIITALSLDMSAAGAATFNAGASFGGTVTADGLTVDGTSDLNGTITVGTTYTTDITGNDVSFFRNNGTSYIRQRGGQALVLTTNDGSDRQRINIASNGDISFYEDTGTTPKLTWDASAELLTTTGLDVTGTATMDGLTVDGDSFLKASGSNTTPLKVFSSSSATNNTTTIELGDFTGGGAFEVPRASIIGQRSGSGSGGLLRFTTGESSAGTLTSRLEISDGGDISFYEDTGTTAKLFWDASAERLFIGATSASALNSYSDDLIISNTTLGTGAGISIVSNASNGYSNIHFGDTDDADIARIQYNNATNEMTFRTNATDAVTIDDSQNVGIGTSPAQKLHVVGTGRPALFGSDNAVNIVKLYNSATGSGTYNGLDLLVNSTSNATIKAYGMPLTFSTSASNGTDVTERMRLGTSEAVVNENSNDYDFRVESDGNANMLFVDAGTNRVGLRTNAPSDTLDVRSGGIRLYDNTDGNGGVISFGSSAGYQTIGGGSGSNNMNYRTYANHVFKTTTGPSSTTDGTERMSIGAGVVINETGADTDFRVESDSNTHALFVNAGNENVSIKSAGYTTATDLNLLGAGLSLKNDKNGSSNNWSLIQNTATTSASNLEFITGIGTALTLNHDRSATFGGDVSVPNISVADNIRHTSDFDTNIAFGSNLIDFYSGSSLAIRLQPIGATFNETGASNVDFRVESDSNTHALFVDANNDTVNINRSSGPAALNVQSDSSAHGIAIYGRSSDEISQITNYNSSGSGLSQLQTRTTYTDLKTLTDVPLYFSPNNATKLKISTGETVVNDNSKDHDFRVESDSNSHMLFVDAGANKVGINRSDPDAILSIRKGGLSKSWTPDSNDILTIENNSSAALDIRVPNGSQSLILFSDSAARAQGVVGYAHGAEQFYITQNNVKRFVIENGHTVFNDTGVDQDFRVESDTNSHMLFMDAVNNRVNIGTTDVSSQGTLAVNGSAIFGRSSTTTGDLFSSGGGNSSAYNGIAILSNSDGLTAQANTSLSSWIVDIGGRAADGVTFPVDTADSFVVRRVAAGGTYYGSANYLHISGGSTVINEDSNDHDFRVESDSNTHALFVDAGNNHVNINTSVDSGGTLNVAGDIFNDLGDDKYFRRAKYINPRSVCDGVYGGYLLLVPYHSGSATTGAAMEGTFIASRGSSGTGNSPARAHVWASATYVNTLAWYKREGSEQYFQSLVRVTYNGTEYVALKFGSSGGGPVNGIYFDGWSLRTDSNFLFMVRDTEITGSEVAYDKPEPYHKIDVSSNQQFEYGSTFNEAGGDHDFRVESDTNANMLFVDASTNRVGIGHGSPNTLFSVQGAYAGQIANFFDTGSNGDNMHNGAAVLGVSRVSNGGTSLHGPIFEVGRDNSNNSTYNVDKSLFTVRSDATVVNEDSENYDFRVESDGDTHAIFVDAGNDIVCFGTSSATGVAVQNADQGAQITVGGRLFTCSTDHHDFNRTNNGDIIRLRHSANIVGSISVTSSATAYNTSSDARLKENIADAEDAGELIDAIQVRQFDWIADGEHQRYGMVAQELNTVAPEAVSEGETEDDMMAVDYSKLVPMLIKEIQSLRARVAQLESN